MGVLCAGRATQKFVEAFEKAHTATLGKISRIPNFDLKVRTNHRIFICPSGRRRQRAFYCSRAFDFDMDSSTYWLGLSVAYVLPLCNIEYIE